MIILPKKSVKVAENGAARRQVSLKKDVPIGVNDTLGQWLIETKVAELYVPESKGGDNTSNSDEDDVNSDEDAPKPTLEEVKEQAEKITHKERLEKYGRELGVELDARKILSNMRVDLYEGYNVI